jgi:hypothetical protein
MSDTLTYPEATARREAAEERRVTALADVEEARRAQAELRQRLSGGDATVTAGDLASADADIERRTLLAQAAAAAVRSAKALEAPLAAAHLAEVLAPVVDPKALHEAQAKAAQTITAALVGLAEVAAVQRATVAHAMTAAKAVNLQEERMRLAGDSSGGFLILDGKAVRPEPVDKVLAEALAEGAKGAAWRFAGALELSPIEPPRERVEDTSPNNGLSWQEFGRLLKVQAPATGATTTKED